MKNFFVILTAILIGCATYQGAFNPTVIEDAIEGLAVVRTEAKVLRSGAEAKYEMKGIAIHLDNGLILALTHTTKTPSYIMFRTPFGNQPYPQKVISEKWFINGEEIELIGRHEDISLFRSKSKKRFPFALGDSDKVKIGTKVIVIGWSFAKAVNIKEGIVSRTKIVAKTYSLDGSDKDTFLITAPVNPGDSGSPMIAQKLDGEYEIIGIVNAGIVNKGMGFSFKSNWVLEAIRKIKNG